ncbi:MAG: GNAT family N-acetyltransferase [Lachnospiraceae bacterium]|nr:GNAT family N-acetyltransferase [Lachnospiraceae bacterium]
MQVIRATRTAEQAGAYYVRIQAMARKYHITLKQEFDEHDTPDTQYIVLLDDDFPVATCRMYPCDERSVMLGRIVVLPEYRGQGLGRKTVEEAEKWAAELGYERAVLESREEKTGFYEKMGYVADYGNVIHGETFVCVHMEKSLR